MNPLRRLGFRRNWVYETIVATASNRKKNVAPIGVWSPDLQKIKLRINKKTKTCSNILTNSYFAVNFPGDIETLYDAFFRKDKIAFKEGTLFLSNCPAVLESEALDTKDLGEWIEVTAKILSYRIMDNVKLINRAEYLALDSLIVYSKLPFSPKKNSLRERLRENLRIIKKTAPQSCFVRLVEELIE